MGRKTSDRDKVFLKQCQMFFKENMHNLKSKLNPMTQFIFKDGVNETQVKKLFIDIEDPESVFFPKDKHHCKQITCCH